MCTRTCSGAAVANDRHPAMATCCNLNLIRFAPLSEHAEMFTRSCFEITVFWRMLAQICWILRICDAVLKNKIANQMKCQQCFKW